MLKLPMRWSERVRHQSLSVSSHGRELTFNGEYPRPSQTIFTDSLRRPIKHWLDAGSISARTGHIILRMGSSSVRTPIN
jgi:hypothetical protein